MDLQKHYDSYLESLRGDALEHYEQFAKDTPTKNAKRWPTIFDYVCEVVGLIKDAISRNDKTAYLTLLGQHQQAMIAMFCKMVEELTWKCKEDYAEDLLKHFSRGWKGSWIKFFNNNYKTGRTNRGEMVTDWTLPFEE